MAIMYLNMTLNYEGDITADNNGIEPNVQSTG